MTSSVLPICLLVLCAHSSLWSSYCFIWRIRGKIFWGWFNPSIMGSGLLIGSRLSLCRHYGDATVLSWNRKSAAVWERALLIAANCRLICPSSCSSLKIGRIHHVHKLIEKTFQSPLIAATSRSGWFDDSQRYELLLRLVRRNREKRNEMSFMNKMQTICKEI